MSSTNLAALATVLRVAQERSHARALRDTSGRAITYAELAEALREIGELLAKGGIGTEDVVAVLLPTSALQVIAVAGILNTCACAALQSKSTTDELREWLLRIRPAAILLAQEAQPAADLALSMGLIVFVAKPGDSPSQWRVLRPPVLSADRRSRSGTLLYLMTSGTTSSSKIVPLTVQNLDAGIEARRRSLQLSQTDRMLLMTSMCHIIGVENVFAQFLAEGEVIATAGFDPVNYLGWLRAYQPTWYDCSPTVHQAALEQLEHDPLPEPVSLRFLQSAGAPLLEEVKSNLETILRIPVFNDYGMTEACPIAVDAFLPGGKVAGSAGRSCGLEIAILDSDGKALPPDTQGEIAVRGAAVISGYLDQPEADAAMFRNGWFLTGDAGYLDAQQNLFITGRFKEMINRGGEKISPSEIDAVMASHPTVLEAAAFGVPHRTLGEDVACAVILRPERSTPVSGIELRRFAAEHLARFKVPHRIYFVDAIPRGELGKPQRHVLRERFGMNSQEPPSYADMEKHVQAGGWIYLSLHEIWARILDFDFLGADEDFFEAGGDSLAAMNMLAEVDERFGSNTSAHAADFLDEPTLDNLIRLIGRPSLSRPLQDEPRDMRIFPVRGTGAPRVLYCIPTDTQEGLYYHRLAKHLHGQMDIHIVRPFNTFYSDALYALENAGEEAASVIQKAQPQGPYFVSGYCYGGVVAVETARQLVKDGHDVHVILYEVPTPGSPGILRDWKFWFSGARRQWHALWTREHPGLTRNSRRFARHLIWSVSSRFRRVLAPLESSPSIQRLIRWVQDDEFPLYLPRPVDAPFLHFLCAEEPKPIESASRFGWRRIAKRGIEEQYLPATHNCFFVESNLPEMSRSILKWIGAVDLQGRANR